MASSLRLILRPSVFSKQSLSSPILSRQFTTARPLLFRASNVARILPAGAQTIQGTVNDPVPIPEPHKAHGSYHWTFERALSLALVPLIVTPFVTGSSTPVLDALIGSSVVLHSHIGFDAMVTDYIPKRHYPKTYFVFYWGLRLATVVVLVGLYEFQVNDVGIVEGVKTVWKA